jgi:predicted O-methyltransferase YrrM
MAAAGGRVPTAFRGGNILVPETAQYLLGLLPEADEITAEMRDFGRSEGVPIVHDDTGKLLELVVRMVRPRHVIEFGTAIGYSTLHIARALTPGSIVTSFEIDKDRHAQASEYLTRAGVMDRARLQLGDARELCARVTGPVDMAFLDAAKDEYGSYLDLALEHMHPGGVVLVDNALMSGTVATGESDGHWGADSIAHQREFNAAFANHPRLDGMVLAVGDGVGFGVVRDRD